MSKITSTGLLLVLIPVFILGTISCKSGSSSSSEEDSIRDYADPATETTLQGLSDNNLSKYIENGNEEFKAALTQQVFDTTAAQISEQLGTYKSIEFLRSEEQEGYIIVHYTARFSKGNVGVRMVFDKDHLVAGQWFE